MDKYEYKVRADEIKSLIAEGEYAEAVKIADTIDWRRVKSVMMLCTISDLYKINRRYEDSRDILLLAYEKHTGGRLIVYSLCELSIKLEEYVQAIEYYKEFVQLAPKDSGRYVLQYKLYEAQEVSLEERIAVLEEFKKKDYREKWAYELAYLYHRVGLASRCVEECDEIFLWFGEGRYVLKALELKQLHQPLSPEQQESYDKMKQTGGILEPELATERNAIREEAKNETEEEEDDEFSRAQNLLTDPTREIPSEDLDDIQVKTVDVSQYNTINLQKELAESMKEFLGEPQEAASAAGEDTAAVYESSKEKETGDGEEELYAAAGRPTTAEQPTTAKQSTTEKQPTTAEQPAADGREVSAETGEADSAEPSALRRQETDAMQLITEETLSAASGKAKKVSEEVFFGNTSEVNIEDVVSELAEKNAGAALKKPASPASIPYASVDPSISNTGVIKTFHKPSGYDDILSQEYDGQISLVVPEQDQVEKQITGQLSIDDVMAEWEKIKKENERKRMEEIRERVHKQTDTLFADFDESTKSGLLEELEKAMVTAALKEEKKKAELERPKVVKVADIAGTTAGKELFEETASAFGEIEDLDQAAENTAAESAGESAAEEATGATAKAEEATGREPVRTQTAEAKADPGEKDATTESGTTEDEITEEEFTEDETIEEESAEEPDEAILEEETETAAAPADVLPTGKKMTAEEIAAAAALSEDDSQEQEETAAETGEQGASEEGTRGSRKKEKATGSGEKKIGETAGKGYRGREMTAGEREQFAPFIHHRKTRRQIVEAIDNISMAAYTGNVVITGEEGTGTITLAKLLVKEIQLSDSNFSGKVAKISGATMNKKDVAATLAKLEGGALIIEGATAMKKSSVNALLKTLNQEDKGLIVLLEDTKQAMNDFLGKHEGLAPVFNLRVDVEALDDQTLVKYARKYALEQEYAIDELGILALHTRIADMQTSDHEVTLAEIEELVDEAIYYADKKTPRHFFDVLFNKRYDEEDMIILREKDFMHY